MNIYIYEISSLSLRRRAVQETPSEEERSVDGECQNSVNSGNGSVSDRPPTPTPRQYLDVLPDKSIQQRETSHYAALVFLSKRSCTSHIYSVYDHMHVP